MQIFSSIDGLPADIGHKLKAMDQSANHIKERVRGMNFVASYDIVLFQPHWLPTYLSITAIKMKIPWSKCSWKLFESPGTRFVDSYLIVWRLAGKMS